MTVVLLVAARLRVRRAAGSNERLSGRSRSVRRGSAYAGWATHGAVAYERPGGAMVARFGAHNAERLSDGLRDRRRDGRPHLRRTLVSGAAADPAERQRGLGACTRARRRAGAHADRRRPLRTTPVVVPGGRLVLRAPVGVGSPSTPTPTGRFYVDQRLVPDDRAGPFGPAALGISAFSPVLTWWPQGGPIAIHGTDEPASIGQARSNGCIRLQNATLARVFASGRRRDPGRRPAVGRGATALER